MLKQIKTTLEKAKDAGPLLQLRKRRYEHVFAHATDLQLFRGVYDTFAEAALQAPATRPLGYDNPGPSSMYRELVDKVTPRDYPLMFWLSHGLRRGVRRVLDFGGHVGIKFYAFSKYLDCPADFRWTVCDVPAVVEAGEKLKAVMAGSRPLRFTTRFEEAADADLFLAAGALQYVEEPLHARLERLERRPPRLLLSGVPLHARRSFVTLQSIGTAYCPYKVFSREAFVGGLTRLGYVLRDEWLNVEKNLDVPFHRDARVDNYTGLYFETQAVSDPPEEPAAAGKRTDPF